ncbi:hypothetical protein HPB50_001351 [Hyalomma asiaticum]|uniref:Uncharacterized protein n=1 Tax=Hyalomma asiaticum TaxID=266040 RepID=A0ACB7TA86_HYAAI|nr:hypothetical protein HPB50_001351 [Hyalomma asiaticum]
MWPAHQLARNGTLLEICPTQRKISSSPILAPDDRAVLIPLAATKVETAFARAALFLMAALISTAVSSSGSRCRRQSGGHAPRASVAQEETPVLQPSAFSTSLGAPTRKPLLSACSRAPRVTLASPRETGRPPTG